MMNLFKKLGRIKNLEYLLLGAVLLLGFLVRLYKITNPVADWHSWRQADTASVTRIYVEKGINLLLPRYHDISSIQTGIYNPKGLRMVEFPIYNAIHALLVLSLPKLSLEIWGRVLSIIFSLISTVCLFAIGKKFMGRAGGILSAFFFAFLPYNIYFSRVILPEPAATAFALISMYLFIKFIDTELDWQLYISAVFFALSLLIKPFTFFYIIPLFYLLVKKYGFKKIFQSIKLALAFDIALAPFFLWRIWVNQFPAGIPHFEWAFNGDKIRFRPAFWRWIFGERLGNLILGIWGILPFTLGILKTATFNLLFLFGMFFYMTVVATASVRHDYYQIFIIPAICLVLAQGVINLWNTKSFNRFLSRSVTIFSIFMMFGISGYQVKEFYKINHPEIIEAGAAVDRLTPKDALVIAPYNGDTAFLYQTERRGWPVVEESFDQVIAKGASFYVSVNFNDPDTKYVMGKYKVLEKTDKYVVVDLRNAKK